MVDVKDIGWGSYKQFEGPFYSGRRSYRPSAHPSRNERLMAVVAATEGGHYDAFNGYDVCGWTSGIIQWCELSQYSVSDMLGAAAKESLQSIQPFLSKAEQAGLSFKKNAKGRWRLHFEDERGEVDRKQEQLQLFYLDGNGTKGTWHKENRQNALEWAAAISTVWEDPKAQKAQLDFTVPRMSWFTYGRSKDVVAKAPDTELGEAFVAAYTSFAANNPVRANKHLSIAMESTQESPYSLGWLITVLKELTFGPKIAIYPHRYNAIRPVLELIYGVNLPDLAQDLEHWKGTTGIRWVLDTKELQMALLSLGYDLGPYGADGRFGPKTREAVLTFEQLHRIPSPDGYPGPDTVRLLELDLERQGHGRLTEKSS